MRINVFLGVLLLAGCASEPVDPWLGGYDVAITERAWPCADLSAMPREAVSRRTWMVEHDGADVIVVPGSCSQRYRVHTPTRAELEPRTCEVTAGVRTHVEMLGGHLYRDGARIWGTVRLEMSADGQCAYVEADVQGERY